MEGLCKEYEGVVAVGDVSFEVKPGEVFGFLGPNGAGKTTTIKILTTLIPPTTGRARVLGFDVNREGARIRSRIGLVQQQPSYDYRLSVEDALDLYGLMWNMPKAEIRSRVEELLESFDLKSHRHKRPPELSIGLRRRLQVAREFMHDMELLFLDEPTVGLDPIARRKALDMIRARVRAGLTVFFTTHILEEVEYFCDRVAIINQGHIVTVDTPRGLKDKFGGLRTIEVIVDGRGVEALVAQLRTVEGVETVTHDQDGLIQVWTSDPSGAFRAIILKAEYLGLHLSHLALREPSLEQAFISVVSKG